MHREEEQAIATPIGMSTHSAWNRPQILRGHTAIYGRSIAGKTRTQWVVHLREYAPWQRQIGTIVLTILLLLTAVPASAGTLPTAHADSSANAPGTDADIVINEIYYLPGVANDPLEFIELYNRGSKSVDLSSWGLHDAVTYQIPAGTSLQAGGYLIIAQDPQRFQEHYKSSALGPYSGRLAAEGETISLYTNGILADQVSYGLGFPWPVAGGSAGTSIQLLHPSLDNGTAGHWRSAAPTPGRPNVGRTLDLPPAIHSVTHAPASPRSGESVRVTATVSDPDEVGLVELLYQVVAPGAYISLDDPGYATGWTALTMTPAGENSYIVDLPARLQRHRNLIRYRIRAGDRLNYQITVPYGDDPQPNFAYFVYDGEPTWSGSIDGGAAKRATYDFDKMRPLPVYHLIASKEDVADAMFIPDSDRKEGYIGSEYPWRATFVYEGIVYDHISFRARGGQTRYATGKNMLKFNFNRGHRLQAYDNYGRPYQVKWDKLNLSAVIQQTHRLHRGEQGMFESLSFRLFNMSGVEAPLTHFIRLRIIDQQSEEGGSQYDGDFWGLYLAIEQMDGRFLEEHNLADGNLYKMEYGTGELNNLGATAVSNKSDLNGFIAGYNSWPSSSWWRKYLDLDRYYSYRAIVEALHHYDIDQGKNFFYYLNPNSAKWSVHPWDVDLTWAANMPGSGEEAFQTRVLSKPAFAIDYRNRLREIRDLLFNDEQVGWMLAEHAQWINSGQDGQSMVKADRARWDYAPVFLSRYVDRGRTEQGHFYRKSFSSDFEGMLDLMKRWTEERSEWIDEVLLSENDHPRRPTISFVGPTDYPADDLTFGTTGFADPQGGNTFGAMQWRIAQVAGPGSQFREPNGPVLYEMDASWLSEELTTFQSNYTFPAGSCPVARRCRARVRMKDSSGRWSHWSHAVDFVAGPPRNVIPSGLIVSEIMFEPRAERGIPGDEYEFVEILNSGSQTIDLSRMRFTAGIEYTFAEGSQLEPGAFLVLAENREQFKTRYEFAPYDEYGQRLADSGETITLVDAYDRVIFSISYSAAAPWPVTGNEVGNSLVIANLTGNLNEPATWRASTAVDGSPGLADPLPILINEVLANPGSTTEGAIELHNPTNEDADISFWYLSHSRSQPRRLQFPAGTGIPARNYLVVGARAFSAQSDEIDAIQDQVSVRAQGGELVLSSGNASGRLTGYQHQQSFGPSDSNISFGRVVDSSGKEHFVPQESMTLGTANSGPRSGAVVISELMYHPSDGFEYLEIVNRSSDSIKLYDQNFPGITWRITGLDFYLPPGVEIHSGERLAMVPISPTTLCESHSIPPQLRLIGPYTTGLADDGMTIALQRPIRTGKRGTSAYVSEDIVTYDNVEPWSNQAAGRGAALERVDIDTFGSEPANWVATPPLQAGVNGQTSGNIATLCSFEIDLQSESGPTTSSEASQEATPLIRWSTHIETNVEGYHLWRKPIDGDAEFEQITTTLIPAQVGASRHVYSYRDGSATTGEAQLYALEVVYADQTRAMISRTAPVPAPQRFFFPLFLQ